MTLSPEKQISHTNSKIKACQKFINELTDVNEEDKFFDVTQRLGFVWDIYK